MFPQSKEIHTRKCRKRRKNATEERVTKKRKEASFSKKIEKNVSQSFGYDNQEMSQSKKSHDENIQLRERRRRRKSATEETVTKREKDIYSLSNEDTIAASFVNDYPTIKRDPDEGNMP